MAVANIYVYCGEGGWSVDDVNRLSESISKRRSWESHEGISLCSLTVLTNESSDSFYRQVKVKPWDFEFEGFWNTAHCYQAGAKDMHDEDKVIVLTQPTIGIELIGIPMLESAPVQGSTENAAKSIADEDKALVKEQQLYPIQQFDNWWNDETDMSPFWIGVAAGTARWIYNEFKSAYEEISGDYDPTCYGLQQWLECDLEEKLFWLNHAHGINAPYHVNNKDVQLQRNELWESQVRPWFASADDGYGWRGLGGDEEAELFSYDHEYRDISRQVSFITFEGDTSNITEDEYVRWWML